MKKTLIAFIALFVFISNAYAENYDALYDAAEPFQSKLYNDIDPFEDQDNIIYAWSPYPLFRTSAELYFKDYKIDPGYYLLTPRELGGKDYVLFKQNGKVAFVIPVAKKEATPLNFYNANTPEIKKTKWQKFTAKIKKKFYDTAKDSGRSTPPNSMVNVTVEVKYIIINFYYGENKYVLLFKRSPY
ncbi:hypothetical protein IJD44_07250 [bacterium]|nr:hypothetical protein [bacterium]